MTVSAAARRKADAVEADNGGAEKGVLPPSSFRAVALVGAPRWDGGGCSFVLLLLLLLYMLCAHVTDADLMIWNIQGR